MSLSCQRDLFEVPREVAYLDSAAYGLLPHAVRAAGEAGVATKSRPWAFARTLNDQWAERARAVAARLIGAATDDIAIIGSISHGLATIMGNLAPERGFRVLRLADEHSSIVLAAERLAVDHGLVVDVVARPADGDWTSAVQQAIARPGAPPLAVAALTPLHWSDGALVDLDVLAPAIRAQGAVFIVDATQTVGAVPTDVASLRPDFLLFPTYKWLLGPYSLAFLYAAPHRQTGRPSDGNGSNLPNGQPARGARRFDKGERNDPVALPMAAVGMEQIEAWGVPAIQQRLWTLTSQLAGRIEERGWQVLPADQRCGHILGARRRAGLAADLIPALAQAGVHVSDRLGVLRISPHVWVDDADLDRVVAALA